MQHYAHTWALLGFTKTFLTVLLLVKSLQNVQRSRIEILVCQNITYFLLLVGNKSIFIIEVVLPCTRIWVTNETQTYRIL